MRLSAILGLGAVLVATAIPAIGSAQRYGRGRTYGGYNRNYGSGYGRGPFYPSWTPGPTGRYYGSGAPLRIGGARVTFGPGGGYYGYTPYSYGYAPYGYYGGTTYYSAPGYRYRPGNNLYRPHRHRR